MGAITVTKPPPIPRAARDRRTIEIPRHVLEALREQCRPPVAHPRTVHRERPLHCEHANECPVYCPCSADCYCRTEGSCR